MTQQVLNVFLAEVRTATNNFTESRSSLRHLIAELRNRIRDADRTPITFDDALRLTRNGTDARLTKYHTAIRNLCRDWGAPVVAPPRVVHVPPPRIVPLASLPAMPLIERHLDGLREMSRYAVGDATTFQCGNGAVLARERELRATPPRTLLTNQAEQAAGGRKSYPQTLLRSVHEKVTQAQAGICTTFALAAAYVLTGGVRQDAGTARVEIVGTRRGLATHMYVVVGRQGVLNSYRTWGAGCRVVDCWAAAMMDGGDCVQDPANWPEKFWMLQNLVQVYDSTAADPTVDELAQQVNTVALDRHMEQRREDAAARRRDETAASEFAPKVCPNCGKGVAPALMASHQAKCKPVG